MKDVFEGTKCPIIRSTTGMDTANAIVD
jgi:hypothetical protein